MQLVDGEAGVAGNWVSLPATFARAPEVARIVSSTGAAVPCRLYGTGLAAIDAVEDASGAYVAPGLGCPPTEKGIACVYVPHVAHYTVRLIDAAALETLPDGSSAPHLRKRSRPVRRVRPNCDRCPRRRGA